MDRHDTAYCLWEASLKLLGSAAIVAYAERGEPAPELRERLENLARPALGHWWEFVRVLLPPLADASDAGFSSARDLVLGRGRDDLPRATGLDAALREELDGAGGARATVRLSELFDRLVRYRNREIGHGALGQRAPGFYDRVGRALLLGVAEVLGRLDVLAGRRLIAVTDVRRQPSGEDVPLAVEIWAVPRSILTRRCDRFQSLASGQRPPGLVRGGATTGSPSLVESCAQRAASPRYDSELQSAPDMAVWATNPVEQPYWVRKRRT